MFNLIVFGFIATAMLVLGYQVKYKKRSSLISGFNEDLVSDVNGLCNWVGTLMFVNAAIALSTGIFMTWAPRKMTFSLIYFIVGILITSVFAVVGKRKFKKL